VKTNLKNGQTKTDRYDWARPGDMGKQCRLAVDSLKIDHSYQRNEVSEHNTLAIARAFVWTAFNAITVMERANGDRYVVDGQQRLLAARRRQDITEVPCVLFQSDGRDHEARAFLALNVRRAHVPSVIKYRASVRAGVQPETQIAAWLATQGLTVTQHGTDPNGVDFPTTLIQHWKIDAEASKVAIATQRAFNGSDPLHSVAHRGLWWLAHGGIDIAAHADKIKRRGGLSEVLRAVRHLRIEAGLPQSTNTCGLAILRIINYKRRGHRIAPRDATSATP
jgi:hypothetical protein